MGSFDMKRAFPLILVMVLASCGGFFEEAVRSPVIENDEVIFRLKSPSARTVQVAGDWPGNNWGRGDAEEGEVLVGLMKKSPDTGIWEITITLRAGRYRYRFIIDELENVLDPNNPRVVEDGMGGKANLLIMI